MSLTAQDLEAIEGLLDRKLDERFSEFEGRMLTRFDEQDRYFKKEIEDLWQSTAAGFEEVNGKCDDVKVTVDRIDRQLQAEIARADRQDMAIKHIRKHLHAA